MYSIIHIHPLNSQCRHSFMSRQTSMTTFCLGFCVNPYPYYCILLLYSCKICHTADFLDPILPLQHAWLATAPQTYQPRCVLVLTHQGLKLNLCYFLFVGCIVFFVFSVFSVHLLDEVFPHFNIKKRAPVPLNSKFLEILDIF